MINNDPINVLCNWEGEERERSTQHASDLFLIIQWLLMGLKQTNIRVLQRGFSFLMENIVVFGGGEQMDSHSADETKVASTQVCGRTGLLPGQLILAFFFIIQMPDGTYIRLKCVSVGIAAWSPWGDCVPRLSHSGASTCRVLWDKQRCDTHVNMSQRLSAFRSPAQK